MSGKTETTSWTAVLAEHGAGSPLARAALTELCETYWFPVYALIRRLGHGADEAAHLTHGYFLAVLEKDFLDAYRPQAARFRSFLAVSARRFVSDERYRDRARKRPGQREPVSLDAAAAEDRYRAEIADDDTPENVFEKQWAMTVLERALAALGGEMAGAGQSNRFEMLRPALMGEEAADGYQEAARGLGTSEAGVRAAVRAMRKRFGELLRAEVSRTVAREDDVDAEIRHLLLSLRG